VSIGHKINDLILKPRKRPQPFPMHDVRVTKDGNDQYHLKAVLIITKFTAESESSSPDLLKLKLIVLQLIHVFLKTEAPAARTPDPWPFSSNFLF
jgi:hypothetical protein